MTNYSLSDGAFNRAQALAQGWTPAMLRNAYRSGVLLRPYRGVYLPATASPLAWAGAVALATGGVASHLTAARAYELWVVEDGEWATVSRSVHRRRDDRVRCVRDDLVAADVAWVGGSVPVTTPIRTVRDLCLRSGRLQAVCGIESALRADLLTPADLRALRTDRNRLVRLRANLADSRSESPLETAVRLELCDAGIPVTPQVTVRDATGTPVARLDLQVTGTRVAIECDGRAVHAAPEAVYRDRARGNALAGSVEILRFTWPDLRRDGYLVATVRRAIALSGRRRQPRRRQPRQPQPRQAQS